MHIKIKEYIQLTDEAFKDKLKTLDALTLKDLQTGLKDIAHKESSNKQHASDLRDIIDKFLVEKKISQTAKYGKPISAELESMLQKYFPNHDNIHSQNARKSTPFVQAILLENLTLIKELLNLDHIESFLDESFQNALAKAPKLIFHWLMNEIITTVKNKDKINKNMTMLTKAVTNQIFKDVQSNKDIEELADKFKLILDSFSKKDFEIQDIAKRNEIIENIGFFYRSIKGDELNKKKNKQIQYGTFIKDIIPFLTILSEQVFENKDKIKTLDFINKVLKSIASIEIFNFNHITMMKARGDTKDTEDAELEKIAVTSFKAKEEFLLELLRSILKSNENKFSNEIAECLNASKNIEVLMRAPSDKFRNLCLEYGLRLSYNKLDDSVSSEGGLYGTLDIEMLDSFIQYKPKSYSSMIGRLIGRATGSMISSALDVYYEPTLDDLAEGLQKVEMSSKAEPKAKLDNILKLLKLPLKLDAKQIEDLNEYFKDALNINNPYPHQSESSSIISRALEIEVDIDDDVIREPVPVFTPSPKKVELYSKLKTIYDTFCSRYRNNRLSQILSIPKFETVRSIPVTMDDRLFGHIHNDHALKGTTLEGSQLIKTLTYLKEYVDETILASKESSAFIQDLNKLQKKLEAALSIEHSTHSILKNEDTLKVPEESVIQELSHRIFTTLKANGELLIPGGWTGLNNTSGHAMLYEIKKGSNGKYQFIIHNTGAGLSNHAQKEVQNAIEYSSIKAYELPCSSLEACESGLKSLIRTLVKPNVTPIYGKEAYNADKLYQEIEKVTKQYGFPEIPNPNTYEWIPGQQSGTCTWQVIGESYLKTFPFSSTVKPSDLTFEIRRDSILKYYHTQKSSKRLSDPTVQRQLSFALQNFALLIQELRNKKPPLPEAKANEASKLIQEIQKGLNETISTEAKKVDEGETSPSKSHVARKKDLPQYFAKFATPFTSSSTISSETAEAVLTHPIPTIVTTPADLQALREVREPPINDLVKFEPQNPMMSLKKLLDLCQKNTKNGYPDLAMRCIEHFYLNTPLRPEAFASIGQDKEILNSCMETIQQLNSLYALNATKQSLAPYSEKSVILLKGYILGLNIFQQYFNDSPIAKNEIIAEALINVRTQYSNLVNSSFFLTCNPVYNKEIEAINLYFNNLKEGLASNYTKPPTPLHAVILSRAHTQKLLCERYEINKKDFWDADKIDTMPDPIKAVNYYISGILKKESPNDLNIPEIKKISQDLSCALQLERMSTEIELYTKGHADALYSVEPEQNTLNQFIKHQWHYAYTNPNSGKWEASLASNLKQAYQSTQEHTDSQTQPPLNKGQYKSLLAKRPDNSNHIYANLEEVSGLSFDAAFKRTLLNTRVNPNTQIAVTLDLLKKGLDKCDDLDFQTFAFVNLFQRDHLEKQLGRNKNLLVDFTKIIEQGLKINRKKDKVKSPIFFFFKINFALHHFLIHMDEKDKNSPVYIETLKKLSEFENQIPELIQYYEKLPQDNYSISILRQLHNLNLIRLSVYHEENPKKMDEKNLQAILKSLFFCRNNSQSQMEDPFIEHFAQNAGTELGPLIRATIESKPVDQQMTLMTDLATHLGFMLPKTPYQWIGHYPQYQLMSQGEALLSLDFQNGQIFKQGLKLVPLPSEIRQNPLFIEFFGNRSFLAEVSKNGKHYSFEVDGIKYRFIKESLDKQNKPQGVIQREIEVDGIKSWYEYQTPINIQIDYSNLTDEESEKHKIMSEDNTLDKEPDAFSKWVRQERLKKYQLVDLPRTVLEQDHYRTWVRVEKKYTEQQTVITDEISRKPILMVDNHECIVHQLDDKACKTNICLASTKKVADNIQYPFLKFEDSRFTEFRVDKSSRKAVSLSFPRYGLSFLAEYSSSGQVEWLWEQDPRYRIKLEDLSQFIPTFNSAITLTARKGETVEDMVLIPKQQLIATSIKENEYYHLRFDTNNQVIERRLANEGLYKEEELVTNNQLQKFSKQESYGKYKIKPGLELEPESREDLLYLAYLQLAKRQPLLAFQSLQKVAKQQGPLTEIEIEWLRRMMEDIPPQIEEHPLDKKIEDDARIDSPEFAAVRLQAGFILANHKARGLVLESKPESLKVGGRRSATEEYHKLTSQRTQAFFKNETFNKALKKTYEEYKRKLENIPDVMNVSDTQELLILRQFMSTIKNNAPYIVYRRKQLVLTNLLHERQVLEETRNATPHLFTQHQANRLATLNRKIPKQLSVSRSHTEIQEKPVGLLPDQTFNLFLSEKKLLKGDDSIREGEFIPINQFDLDTSSNDFIFSFASFYNLALNANTKAEDREKLKNVIKQSLYAIGFKRQLEPNHPLSLKENLIVILTYILENPRDFMGPVEQAMVSPEWLEGLSKKIHEIKSQNKPGSKETKLISQNIYIPVKIQGALLEVVPKKIVTHKKSLDLSKSEKPTFVMEEEKAIITDTLQHLEKTLPLTKGPLLDLQTPSNENVIKTLYSELATDYSEGIKLNQKMAIENKASQAFCEKAFINYSDEAIQILNNEKSKNEKTLTALMLEILTLSNKPPEDSTQRLAFDLKTKANQRHDLSQEEILALFLHQDRNLFKEKTVLSDAEIDKLNNLIFSFLIQATHHQHNERILKEMSKLKDPKLNEEQRKAAEQQLGTLLMADKPCYEPEKYPEILLFEYLDNKRIFQKQFDYLQALLQSNPQGGFSNQAIQLIMGGGKSKVLLPLLALKKAIGTNISIIEVPDALFKINVADLNSTSQTLFGQTGYPFHFDETVNCNIEYLTHLGRNLRQLIKNRSYMITTKESMQALELKYLNLLKQADPKNLGSLRKIQLLNTILKIFKHQGDVTIDEVDSALDPRKQFIMSVGGENLVTQNETETILNLYEFFDNVSLDGHGLLEIAEGKWTPPSGKLKAYMNLLSKQLINHVKSPIQDIIGKLKLNAQQIEKLEEYLKDRRIGPPDFMESISNSEKDRLALLREEITNILPLTLGKNRDEHFGLSRDPKKADALKEIAIPYLASNIPNETSEFGNYLETLNYTLQIQFFKPLSIDVAKALIKYYKTRIEEEIKLDFGEKEPKYLKTLAEFKELTGKDLYDIELDNENEIKDFHNHITSDAKVKDKVKRYCVLNHILNYVKKNSTILTSDAQNHCSQYRSIQGMTGTNWNHRCYPTRMKSDQTLSLGSDGQTIHNLLRDPKPIHTLEHSELAFEKRIVPFFRNHPNPKTLHAFIDLGAFFKGISNEEIADDFSQFFANQKEYSHLSHVLFFGSDDRFYALPIHKETAKQKPIPLDNSDPDYIKTKLGIEPDKYFTLYDQRRTTGTDIKATVDAHAFVTIGTKTLLRDLLQAVMRLRDLRNNQRVEFIISKELQDAYPDIKKWSVDRVIKMCVDNQINRLAEDHFRSATQKMKNILRNDLFERLLDNHDPLKQIELLQKFDAFFFSMANLSPFEQFGQAIENDKVESVLNDFKSNMTNQWIEALRKANLLPVKLEMLNQIKQQLDEVVKDSILVCHQEVDKIKHETNKMNDSEISLEREAEKETAQELDQEKILKTIKDAVPLPPPIFKSFDIVDWQLTPGTKEGGIEIITLEDMVKTRPDNQKRTWKFSNQLLVSKYFSQTLELQSELLGTYQKDGIFFVMEQTEGVPPAPGTLKSLMVTPEEAAHIAEEMDSQPLNKGRHLWIETSHHTVLAGQRPRSDNIHPDYLKLIEQIALFNGDVDVLYRQYHEQGWMKSEAQDKLQYLEFVSMPAHPDKVNLLNSLRKKMHIGRKEHIEHKEHVEHVEGMKAIDKDKRRKTIGDVSKPSASDAQSAVQKTSKELLMSYAQDKDTAAKRIQTEKNNEIQSPPPPPQKPLQT